MQSLANIGSVVLEKKLKMLQKVYRLTDGSLTTDDNTFSLVHLEGNLLENGGGEGDDTITLSSMYCIF